MTFAEQQAILKAAYGDRYKEWTDDDFKAFIFVKAPPPDNAKN